MTAERPANDGRIIPVALRPAARALIIDPADRVLLVRFDFPLPDVGPRTVWATPGGGIEAGESVIDALHRELREEVGLVDATIGPICWYRSHTFPMGHWEGQHEVVHLVRTEVFDPEPALGWERMRQEFVHDLRWWTFEEIVGSDEVFAPRALADLLAAILREGVPPEPPHIGV